MFNKNSRQKKTKIPFVPKNERLQVFGTGKRKIEFNQIVDYNKIAIILEQFVELYKVVENKQLLDVQLELFLNTLHLIQSDGSD